jgi:hypothetical protein
MARFDKGRPPEEDPVPVEGKNEAIDREVTMGSIRKPGKTGTERPRTEAKLPGKVKPTSHDAKMPNEGGTTDSRNRMVDQGKTAPKGQLICPSCMSFSDGKHWHMDEERYLQLRSEPNVSVVQCPACEKIERQMYDGEIVLEGDWMVDNKEEILNFIHNEEARAMSTNPMARLASLEDRGDSIYILTTSSTLARRIGVGIESAFNGELDLQKLQYEDFIRVRWRRDNEENE